MSEFTNEFEKVCKSMKQDAAFIVIGILIFLFGTVIGVALLSGLVSGTAIGMIMGISVPYYPKLAVLAIVFLIFLCFFISLTLSFGTLFGLAMAFAWLKYLKRI